jgi:hypothetical protein
MMETQTQRHSMMQDAVMIGEMGGEKCALNLKTCTVNKFGQSFLAPEFPESER